jgi:hypothetical protein
MSKGYSLIISIKEAREILGKKYDKYPDEYIQQLIQNLDAIAETFIRTIPKY